MPVKKNKIKRRNDDLKSAGNDCKILVDSNTAKELVEYFIEEKEKSRKHEKNLMQMQGNMHTDDTNPFSVSGNNSSSAMPAN